MIKMVLAPFALFQSTLKLLKLKKIKNFVKLLELKLVELF